MESISADILRNGLLLLISAIVLGFAYHLYIKTRKQSKRLEQKYKSLSGGTSARKERERIRKPELDETESFYHKEVS